MNDERSLRQFVRLANYKDDVGFGMDTPQMPYLPKFRDVKTARTYLKQLNHQLTTLSELTVDKPKTGYESRFDKNQQEYSLPYLPYWFGCVKGQLEPFFNQSLESFSENRLGEHVRTLCKSYDDEKTVKKAIDTLKSNRRTRERWVQRTVELMTDGDTIMGNIQRFVQQNILDMEIDTNACFSILESIKGASCLDITEAECISADVRVVYKDYCRAIAGNIKALKDGSLSQDEFDDALEHIINTSDGKLRGISSDRVAIAFAAYTLSLENGYNSQSFPFLTALDGMVALLSDVRTVDFYDIKIHHIIPDSVSHLVVYNRRFRLPESACGDKVYFGDVALANGSYEVHRSLKGDVSLIVPKPVSKDRLNAIPYNDTATFSLKVSYKASELSPEHQHGEYITELMANSAVTFKETTMGGNVQYAVYCGDVWVGCLFDDQSNAWVLKKEVGRTLMGKEYKLVDVPRTGTKIDNNSFVTSKGTIRTAQVLTFTQLAATLTAVI